MNGNSKLLDSSSVDGSSSSTDLNDSVRNLLFENLKKVTPSFSTDLMIKIAGVIVDPDDVSVKFSQDELDDIRLTVLKETEEILRHDDNTPPGFWKKGLSVENTIGRLYQNVESASEALVDSCHIMNNKISSHKKSIEASLGSIASKVNLLSSNAESLNSKIHKDLEDLTKALNELENKVASETEAVTMKTNEIKNQIDNYNKIDRFDELLQEYNSLKKQLGELQCLLKSIT